MSASNIGALPQRTRISLAKLRLAMLGTWAAIIGLTTLILVALMLYLKIPFLNIYSILGIVVFLHIIQWFIAPYIINAIYKVRPVGENEYPWLHEAVSRISASSGLKKKPRLMIAEINIPNAFAYGSPLTGSMVAVTRGLLNTLPPEEVEAVVAHEIGHVKHRDMTYMMMISIIPALIYYIGYMMYISGLLGGSRSERGGNALAVLIGLGLMVLSFVFNLFVFYFSRLREYYADSHAALSIRNGARNLQRALVRIMSASGRFRRDYISSHDQLKMLFIADPDVKVRSYGDVDELVERVKREKPSILTELFSTHPHPSKRLRHLDKFII